MTEENLGIFLHRLVSLILASALFALGLPRVLPLFMASEKSGKSFFHSLLEHPPHEAAPFCL